MGDPERIRLYLSNEHACGYLPARAARSAYLDPEYTLNPPRYAQLLAQGFRRSGVHVYRPHCLGCFGCQPARILVSEFAPNRNQKRCAALNADIRTSIVHELTDEHYDLYRRYLAGRHAGAGMDADNRDGFHAFLECIWNDTEFWELRENGQLLAVAVTDAVPGALSAVYTFFDPALARRSLGTYAILAQIAAATQRGLDHVYLGYWVAGSQKMDYKKNFSPLQVLTPSGWRLAD